MNKRIFDSSCMVKERPKIPKEYQPDFNKRMLGIISPSLRWMYYNSEFETKHLMWLCWKRQLTKDAWKRLIHTIKAESEDKG